MRNYEWDDERNEIIRPLKKKNKPSVKKSNHKHEYAVEQSSKVRMFGGGEYNLVKYKCLYCDQLRNKSTN